MRPAGIRPLWQEIDLNQLATNMHTLRTLVGSDIAIAAVVKANAYGHGAVDIAPVLLDNGADALAVSFIDEGIELRRSGISSPILLLGYTDPDQFDAIIEWNLQPTIYSVQSARLLAARAAAQGKEVSIHIAIDSGMNRVGFSTTEESIEQISTITSLPSIRLEGIFTHFASADESDQSYSIHQYERFQSVIDALEQRGIRPRLRHAANSAATIGFEISRLDMVRLGIVLYGDYPSSIFSAEQVDLNPVMTLKCLITHIHTIEPGETVSYGRTFTAQRTTQVATLPVGYADGYLRSLSNKAEVLVHGHRAPVIGTICMDQMMIDITDIDDVSIGDEVVLIGSQGDDRITTAELASHASTIPYELLCALADRVPRVYLRDGQIAKIVNYLLG